MSYPAKKRATRKYGVGRIWEGLGALYDTEIPVDSGAYRAAPWMEFLDTYETRNRVAARWQGHTAADATRKTVSSGTG